LTTWLLASKATKQGKQRKTQLEAGYHGSGYRTGWQVLCNSAAALVACVIWSIKFTPHALPWSLFVQTRGANLYDSDGWCPLSPTVADGLSRALVFATLGQFGCCLGDTLASELGILSSTPPILITTFKTVPAGTNGAISVGGTIASGIGGFIVGLTQFACLVVENRACRAEWTTLLPALIGWGVAAGIFGSMLDSLLGATLQRTRYSTDKKWVLQDDSLPEKDETIKVISGINVLTNNQINFVSSAVAALVLSALA